MKLREFLREDFKVVGNIDIMINAITFNSKEVSKGSLFVAITGQNYDGHDFIDEALNFGASAIVYENGRFNPILNRDVTWIGVSESRDALAWISSKFYCEPSKKMNIIGITGTNGKTTTSYLVREILKAYGKKTGLIGTIKYLIDEEERKAVHTTPESIDFQKLLNEMLQSKVEYVISEISSHALALKRVDYTKFKVAAFTNLSRDHLDFHRDMDDYFKAKKRLFTELLGNSGISVINIDDEYGRKLAEETKGKKILYSIENSKAQVYAKSYRLMFNGTEIEIMINGKDRVFLKSSLLGIPNIFNILCAISIAIALEIPVDVIKFGIERAKAPDGRFENINEGQDFLVFIDYAHTPDALERLLLSVSKLRDELVKQEKRKINKNEKGRIITIFGCGGNRDKGKRPLMGEIATRLSDLVILTSDNPRWEEPREIIKEIEEGISKDNYVVVSERADALKIGLLICKKGDILIVAGKGHEDYQEIEGKRYHFSDREVLRESLKGLR